MFFPNKSDSEFLSFYNNFFAGAAIQFVSNQREQDIDRSVVREGGTDRVLLVQGDAQHHRGY